MLQAWARCRALVLDHAWMATTRLVLVRHGETDWSRVGRHTGPTDLALNAQGETEAALVSGALSEWEFESVFASPLQRAVVSVP